MTVGEMLAKMSSRELAEWLAFERMEPFGEMRADLRMGILASTIANVNRDPKQKSKPFTPFDFMPDFDGSISEALEEEKAKKAQTPEEQLAFIEVLNKHFGGKDLRK